MGRTARPRPARGAPLKTGWGELEQLRSRVRELELMRERLSKLYFSQVELGKTRMEKLHRILEIVTQLNSSLEIEVLLEQIVGAVQASLGFRIVLLRILDPESGDFKARAFAGLSPHAIARLQAEDVPREQFLSWLSDEFRVSRSYFISHKHAFSRSLPEGWTPDLGEREDWEWHESDVLFVPLYAHDGTLTAYLSVDDPVDRLVPSRETIEMLEVFGNHVVVALENARLVQRLADHGHELEAANRRMGELNQLKSNFLSAVSHELRTPLTSIRAYLESLRDDLAEREGLDAPLRFVSTLEDESGRLGDLIDSVLLFSHLERGSNPMEFKVLDVRSALTAAFEVLTPLAEAKKVSLQGSWPDADIRMEADLELLKQLVLHLGGNAVKFTAPGGQVRIAAEDTGRSVIVRVEDTGIGIPQDQLERIFERFYQIDSSLRRRFGGTGLGLALCKSIVEVHGGTIGVESAPGEGSRFTVELPRQRRSGEEATVSTGSSLQSDAEEAMRGMLVTMGSASGCSELAVSVPAGDGGLAFRAIVGLSEPELRGMRLCEDEGVSGWILAGGKASVFADPAHDARLTGRRLEPFSAGALVAVPIAFGEGARAALIARPEASAEAEQALELLVDFAPRLAAVLELVEGGLESQRRTRESAASLRRMVSGLSGERAHLGDRSARARSVALTLGLAAGEAGKVALAAVSEGRTQTLSAMGRRIVDVLAAYEALVAPRTSKPPLPPAEAIEELRRSFGCGDDAIVVEALVARLVEEGWLDRGSKDADPAVHAA